VPELVWKDYELTVRLYLMLHLRKSTFLLALLLFSVVPPRSSFSRERNRKPILEYWKSPVIGAWRGTVYSRFFNSSSHSEGDARIQKYSVNFQFDGEKRVRGGSFRGDTLPGSRGKRKTVRSLLWGEFHGTYVLYTNGEIEIKLIVFCKRQRKDYAFPVKFSGKLTDGRKKIKGSGSLNASSAGGNITLGFGSLTKVKY